MVRAGVASTLRAHLARYPKINADRFILEAGLDITQITNSDAMIDLALWVALFDRAAEQTGDSAFGIEYARQTPWKDFGVLGYVLLNSPTIGAGLENVCRFLALQSTHGLLVLEQSARQARLSYAFADPRITAAAQNTEGTFALVTRWIREVTAEPSWGPTEVRFRHDTPSDPRAQERFFRAPVRFGQRANTIVLATTDLAKPSHSADPNLLSFLVRHAEECLARLPKSGALVDEVRGAIVAAISAGEPAIDDVASRLATSARSLQRRLRDEDLSFKSVVDETRLALARRYLTDPALTLTETAFLLGYSDLSAFSRAFRRWTGTTAIEFRRAATPSP